MFQVSMLLILLWDVRSPKIIFFYHHAEISLQNFSCIKMSKNVAGNELGERILCITTEDFCESL